MISWLLLLQDMSPLSEALEVLECHITGGHVQQCVQPKYAVSSIFHTGDVIGSATHLTLL